TRTVTVYSTDEPGLPSTVSPSSDGVPDAVKSTAGQVSVPPDPSAFWPESTGEPVALTNSTPSGNSSVMTAPVTASPTSPLPAVTVYSISSPMETTVRPSSLVILIAASNATTSVHPVASLLSR